LKTLFICGVFLLFHCSTLFGIPASGCLSVDDESGLQYEKHSICAHTSCINPQFHFNSQKNYSEPDTLGNFKVAGDCSPGYLLNNDTSICAGSVFELKSRTALTYQWFPSDGINNSANQNSYVIIDTTRTIYLETTDYSNNLITNPGFELGNIDFLTTYTYCNGINCLSPLGDNGYSIGTDANYFHSYFSGKDHTTGSGNFMIINGARPSLTVWQQTIPVKSFTKYAFGVWISTMITLSPAQIQFSINGSQVGSVFNAPDYANQWVQVFITWNSGSATTAAITIKDILPVLEGNDFGIDDLFFGELLTCSDSVTVTASQNVNLGNDTILYPDQVIVLTPLNGPYEHYNWSNGDTTQSISIHEAGKSWLSVTDLNGCTSTDTINVKNSGVFIVFPGAFTPNGDGTNDVFRPKASNVTKFHLSVFNRWGQFLFETNDIETGWNGKIKGVDYPADLYAFVASCEFQDSKETKTSRGTFRLIR